MPSLATLAGMAPLSPVISPSAAERRLSKAEMRLLVAAYHRMRGHLWGVDYARFRDTLLTEAFGCASCPPW
ncbi:hypothetical protein PINS_up020072 [Pythium insidiosum]|nr:hypothetical protein PINS_up020072 [Pythium insidiosum]